MTRPFSFTSTIPAWLEPPPTDPGSIDPLGFLARAEKLADQLLPGVTVTTRRIRYLSFLCWAIEEAEGNTTEIDRWEVALSVGEHLRHRDETTECSYLGKRLLEQQELDSGAMVPGRLHVQTARLLYSGLLQSCGLCNESRDLTDLGRKIAREFGNEMPRSRPRQIFRCNTLPCISNPRRKERRWLQEALLEANPDAATRLATFRELGKRGWREVARHGPSWALATYLPRKHVQGPAAARHLNEAARLELQSMPLTRLFLHLYQHKGAIAGVLPRQSGFHAYRVREDSSGLLADVAAHLRRASLLGDPIPPLGLSALTDWLCEQHRLAKADAPWIDARWRPLRLGLQPKSGPNVHGYRLTAFTGLLRDLEMI